MIIITQDNTKIIDCEKSLVIYADELGTVYATSYQGEMAFELGVYKDIERAKDVIAEIFTLMGCQDKYEMPII